MSTPKSSLTKEHIKRVILSNRKGIAAHQLFNEFERELESARREVALLYEAFTAIAAAETRVKIASGVAPEQAIEEVVSKLKADLELAEYESQLT